MRIVAGAYRGRRLAAPSGTSTRPTSDRVREALFSALESRLGTALADADVLDAYAGSGALGLEALSRGAASATFVERDRRALSALRRNIETLAVATRVRVVEGDIRRIAASRQLGGPFSLLLLDPPYRIDRSEVRAVVEGLHANHAIATGALIVWEHDSRTEADWPAWVVREGDRRYGSTTVSIGRAGEGDG